MEKPDLGKTSIGMEPNVAGLLCYLLGWISGLVIYLLEKENKFVRFHAFQAMVVFGTLTAVSLILTVIPFIGWMLIPILYVLQLILGVLLMIKAYQGEKFKLPMAGEIAEKNS